MIIAGVYCFFTPVETSAVIPFVLGLGVIGVLIGCGVITAGVNLIYLGCSPWIL